MTGSSISYHYLFFPKFNLVYRLILGLSKLFYLKEWK